MDKLYTLLNDEYNKYCEYFEEYPIEKSEMSNSIVLCKPLLKKLNITILSLYVSCHRDVNIYYFDDTTISDYDKERITLTYNWNNKIYYNIKEVAEDMRNEYKCNSKIMNEL